MEADILREPATLGETDLVQAASLCTTSQMPHPWINGLRDGRAVTGCMVCSTDAPTAFCERRRCCGRVACAPCLTKSCGQCGESAQHHGDANLGRPFVLRLAEAVQATPVQDEDGWWSTENIVDDFAEEVLGDDDEGDANAQTERVPGVTECMSCALSAATPGTSWRICRCYTIYCEACAAGACMNCPVTKVWGTPTADDGDTRGAEAARGHDGDAGRGYVYNQMGITPEDASERRLRLLQQEADDRTSKRAQYRATRRRQEKDGRRPRRARDGDNECIVGSANVTKDASLKLEFEGDSVLRKLHLDYLAVQEHALDFDEIEAAALWLKRHGWQSILHDAYVKNKATGGGTAVLADTPGGLRSAGVIDDPECEGRITLSYGSIGGCVGEVIIGSLYGVSGCKVSRQLKLYYRTAARLMLLGRPFILGGDWQILPAEVMGTGLPDFLDAEVCRPNQPTNLVSGREIDYFLVSKSQLAGGAGRLRRCTGACSHLTCRSY